MIRIVFNMAAKLYMVDCDPLDVVRLVASSKNIANVDVETFDDGKVKIASDAFTVNGPSMAEACERFITRALI